MNNNIVLGLHYDSHDAGAAIVSDYGYAAIAEERLNREKYSSAFPEKGIFYCLKKLNIKNPEDIDLIVTNDLYYTLMSEQQTRNLMPDSFKNIKISRINHHLSHAASAFFVSPFSEAAIMILDGFGTILTGHYLYKLHQNEIASFYKGEKNKLILIHKSVATKEYNSGLGFGYTEIMNLINFEEHNEGKLVGLSSYGNSGYFTGAPRFFQKFGEVDYVFDEKNIKWIKPRKYEKLPDNYYIHIAKKVQDELNEALLDIANWLYKVTKCNNLCISGGVGLNVISNEFIRKYSPFKNIFIQPACSDTGMAFGCALYGYHEILDQQKKHRMETAYTGIEYSKEEILQELKKSGLEYKIIVPKALARIIARGYPVAYFQGGSEYGPRALGNRSILADPRDIRVKQKINEQIKHRESWRPFAPAVLQEYVKHYFEINIPSPFMLYAVKVKENKRTLIPAVVHIDGTARVQTVNKKHNPKFYNLIKEFYKLTKIPVLLNTSFNAQGEPIVESPSDAIKSFKNSKLKYMVINDFLVSNQC